MDRKSAFALIDLPAVKKRGFTLIELLIVIAIIGILAIIVVLNLSNARTKARDVRRKADVKTLSDAISLYYINIGKYPPSSGWVTAPTDGLTDCLVTQSATCASGQATEQFISTMPADPKYVQPYMYQYWRKDSTGDGTCPVLGASKFAVYAKLENPSTADLATISDGFDQCVYNHAGWGMNFRAGN